MFCLNKPGCWFLLAKCLTKHLWKSNILSQDAGHWPVSLLKMKLYHRYFLACFTGKNQLSGFFVCEILEHWLEMSSVRFSIHHTFISHSSELDLHWVPLHVISGKGNLSTILFSFIHVLPHAFSIYIYIYIYIKIYIYINI